MVQRNAAARVGLAVVASALILGMALWALSHWEYGRYRVRVAFADTRGLLAQTPVRMNGVAVGEVAEVVLRESDLKPVAVLAIKRGYRIPANARVRITSGILISNPQVEIYWVGNPAAGSITAADWPAELVDSRPISALAQLSPEADAALRELSVTMAGIGPKLAASIDQMHAILQKTDATMANLQAASLSVHGLVADAQVRRSMHRMLADFEAVSGNAKTLSQGMRTELMAVVKRNGKRVDELANGAVELLQSFTDTVDAARGIMTQLTEQVSDPRLQQSLVDTLDLAKTTMARFSQVAADIHALTGDSQLQSSVRTTMASLEETSQEGKRIAQKFGALAERIKVPSVRPRLGIGQPEPSLAFMLRGSDPHVRVDANVRFPIGDANAFHLGMYDISGVNRLNAQYENAAGRGLAFRYGIHASEIGFGLDWRISPSARLRFDGYNPNDVRLDARALFRVNSGVSAWLGVDSLFRRSTPVVGVELSR